MASSGIFLAFPSAYLSISAENERLAPQPIYLSLEISSAFKVPALSPGGKKTQSWLIAWKLAAKPLSHMNAIFYATALLCALSALADDCNFQVRASSQPDIDSPSD